MNRTYHATLAHSVLFLDEWAMDFELNPSALLIFSKGSIRTRKSRDTFRFTPKEFIV